jgi:hypothetical protein
MARTRNTPVSTTVTRDAADILVAKLNELEGIQFVRDAWENKAPDDYGVVELDGQSMSLWADDRMIEQVFQLKVHLYITGTGDDKVALVQQKLAAVCDGYSLPAHEYAYDIDKNHWTWQCSMIGPLQWEVVTDGQV